MQIKHKLKRKRVKNLLVVFVLWVAELFSCILGMILDLSEIVEQVCIPIEFEAQGICDLGNCVQGLGQVFTQGILMFQIINGDEVSFGKAKKILWCRAEEHDLACAMIHVKNPTNFVAVGEELIHIHLKKKK